MISKKQEDFVWGALVGSAIGAAAALLLTPFSGAEVRSHFCNGFHILNGKKRTHSLKRATTKRSKQAQPKMALKPVRKKTDA